MFNTANLFALVARAVVLFTAMPVHEFSHGYVAYRLGDNTAKEQGRLTLNPFAHLDLLGSVLILFSGFGWAKPVQVDPRNFRKPKWGMALTALAGPLSNIVMALIALVLYKWMGGYLPVFRNSDVMSVLHPLLGIMVTTNLYLAVFNLLPVPPLDGSRIFGAILPDKYYFVVMRYEWVIMVLLFVLIYMGFLSGPLSWLADRVLYALDAVTSPLGWL